MISNSMHEILLNMRPRRDKKIINVINIANTIILQDKNTRDNGIANNYLGDIDNLPQP